MAEVERVQATPAARQLIAQLRERHGAIGFYQSHGCCDGSGPLCFAPGELPLSADDRVLGEVDGVPIHASSAQCDYLQALALTLDVAPGNAGNYSLEDGSGQHFVLHQRLWTDAERVRLPPLLPSLP
jgi:uncharacterized protein (DUF779 family)